MPVLFRDVVQRLRATGFVALRQTGSHQRWRHPKTKRLVTVTVGHMNRQVSPERLKNIIKQAGWPSTNYRSGLPGLPPTELEAHCEKALLEEIQTMMEPSQSTPTKFTAPTKEEAEEEVTALLDKPKEEPVIIDTRADKTIPVPEAPPQAPPAISEEQRFKDEVVLFSEENTLDATVAKYNVPEDTVRRWRKEAHFAPKRGPNVDVRLANKIVDALVAGATLEQAKEKFGVSTFTIYKVFSGKHAASTRTQQRKLKEAAVELPSPFVSKKNGPKPKAPQLKVVPSQPSPTTPTERIVSLPQAMEVQTATKGHAKSAEAQLMARVAEICVLLKQLNCDSLTLVADELKEHGYRIKAGFVTRFEREL